MKPLAVVSMLALAVLLAVWLLGGQEDLSTSTGTEEQPEARNEAPVLISGGSKTTTEEIEPVPEPGVPSTPTTTAGPGVSGTVRYEDGGVPRVFSFVLLEPTEVGGERIGPLIRGKDGSFLGPEVAGGICEIDDMRVDEAPTKVVQRAVQYTPGEPLHIVLRRAPVVRLRVVDETGAVIQGAFAKRDRGSWPLLPYGASHDRWMPTRRTRQQKPRNADANGLIDLPEMNRVTRWFVGAPNHAWKRVSVAPEADETLDVRLAPGGAAALRILKWGEVKNRQLLAYRGEVLPRHVRGGGDTPDPVDGVIQIDGLPVGPLTFVVMAGGSFHGDAIGHGLVMIERGATAQAEIDIEVPEARPTVSLRGHLEIPSEWGATGDAWGLRLSGLRSDPATAGESTRETLRRGSTRVPFELAPLPAGAYRLVVTPIRWTMPVTLEPGMADLTIQLPPPVSVRVRVSAATSLPKDVGLWFAPTREGQFSWRHQPVERDPATGTFAFRCPAGRIKLGVSAEGFQGWGQDVDVPIGGEHRIDVTLEQAAMLRIVLRHAGESVSARGAQIRVSGGGSSRSGPDSGKPLPLAPGTWTVTVDKFAGYRTPPPTQAVLRAGETTTVTIDLERDD